MNATKARAHGAGVLYFLFMIVAIIGEFFFPTFIVPGDAAATARNITSGELTYRIHILFSFVTLVLFIFLVATLYRLFRDVHEGHALRMVLLVAIGIAVSLANMLHRFAPVVLLGGADFLSAFTRPQLEALSMGFLRLHASGSAVSMTFWGLWLFPFGILVMKSGFIPRILGPLLMVAGLAYLASGITSMVLPEHRQAVSRVMMPLYFGEVPIIFWLLIKGAKVPRPQRAALPC